MLFNSHHAASKLLCVRSGVDIDPSPPQDGAATIRVMLESPVRESAVTDGAGIELALALFHPDEAGGLGGCEPLTDPEVVALLRTGREPATLPEPAATGVLMWSPRRTHA